MKNAITRWMRIGMLATALSGGAFAQTAKTFGQADAGAPDPVASTQEQLQQLQQDEQRLEQENQKLERQIQQQNQQRQQEIQQQDKAWEHSLLGIYG
jgi:uncharacterized protein YlxW (UPF0749 family)